jgi:hypothetical protein
VFNGTVGLRAIIFRKFLLMFRFVAVSIPQINHISPDALCNVFMLLLYLLDIVSNFRLPWLVVTLLFVHRFIFL